MFVCRGVKLANYLLENNCKLIKIDFDKNKKSSLIFIFHRDEYLDNLLTKWFNETKKD